MPSLFCGLFTLALIGIYGTKCVGAASETRNLEEFTGINAYGPFDISVSLANKSSLKIEGDSQILKSLNTTIDRYKTLKIRLTGETTANYKGPLIKITALTPSIDNFNTGGVTRASVTKRVATGSFRILANENSSVAVDVDTVTFQVRMTDRATIRSDFRATVFQAVLYGNSKFNASGIADVETVEISQDAVFYGSKLHGGIVTGTIRGYGRGEFNSKQQIQVAVYDQGVANTTGLGVATKDAYGRAKIDNANASAYRHTYPTEKPPTTRPPTTKATTARLPDCVDRKTVKNASPAAKVKLTADDIARAQKNMKFAVGALQFDDTAAAIDALEKTLRLLQTGHEEFSN